MQRIWTLSIGLLLLNSTILLSPVHAQFELPLQVDSVESDFQLGGNAEAEVSATLSPGEKANVAVFELTLTIPEGANSYSQAKDFAKPTVITVDLPAGWKPIDDKFTPTPKPKRAFDELFGKEVEKLIGTTVFSRRYQAPSGTDLSSVSLSGKINFLYCDKGSCTPKNKEFTTTFSQKKKS